MCTLDLSTHLHSHPHPQSLYPSLPYSTGALQIPHSKTLGVSYISISKSTTNMKPSPNIGGTHPLEKRGALEGA